MVALINVHSGYFTALLEVVWYVFHNKYKSTIIVAMGVIAQQVLPRQRQKPPTVRYALCIVRTTISCYINNILSLIVCLQVSKKQY